MAEGEGAGDYDAAKSDLTQVQMENIFPDFKMKLQLYHHCCDKNGKIVKNKEFYAQYKKTPHIAGRRGPT